MARNLYDLGDQCPDPNGAWLNEREEGRSRIVPMGMLVVALAGAGLAVVLLKDSLPDPNGPAVEPTSISDRFALCDDPQGDACVLSGDAYAWRGKRYHVADMKAPDAADPGCAQEAERAAAARIALAAMMNGGAFEARRDPADADPSARLLLRDGVSIGQLMILKGHARPWSDTAPDWCAA
ncbi:MAG: nuclease [Sphingobium sp.]|uniref:nuclease n=1 Tax=Sphingobium sp. TaxID=1912891 RepID=UPI002E1F0E95